MSKAPETKLSDLHGLLADQLSEGIREREIVRDSKGNPVLDGEGTFVTKRCSPSLLNVARQFLKDNGIEAGPDNKAVHDLANEVDQLGLEEFSPQYTQ